MEIYDSSQELIVLTSPTSIEVHSSPNHNKIIKSLHIQQNHHKSISHKITIRAVQNHFKIISKAYGNHVDTVYKPYMHRYTLYIPDLFIYPV